MCSPPPCDHRYECILGVMSGDRRKASDGKGDDTQLDFFVFAFTLRTLGVHCTLIKGGGVEGTCRNFVCEKGRQNLRRTGKTRIGYFVNHSNC